MLPLIYRIGANTFLEAVRQKFFAFVALIALGLLASVNYFRKFDFGSSELKFIADFGTGAIIFFGSILAIVMTSQLFFNEIENRTALTILAKPVRRWEFLAGKFAGVAALLAVFVALMTVVLGAFLYYRESELMRRFPEIFEGGRVVDYAGLAVYGALQWLKYAVLMALTLFICTFSNTNLFSVVMSFMTLIICQVQYIALDTWDNVSSTAGAALLWLVSKVFPNFQIYNLASFTVFPKDGEVAWGLCGEAAAYSAVYLAVFFLLAVYSFRKREI